MGLTTLTDEARKADLVEAMDEADKPKNVEYEDGEVSLEQENIDDFCDHCDHLNICPEYNRVRFTYGNSCICSSVDEVPVYPVTKDIIGLGGVKYSREKDLDKLREVIELKKSQE